MWTNHAGRLLGSPTPWRRAHVAEAVVADLSRAVCEAVSRPVNVLARPGLSLPEIFQAGAQRVSVGGGLTWVAIDAMAAAATAIRDGGDLSSLVVAHPLERWLA